MSPSHSPVPEDDARRALRADCSTCFALCCAALGFRRSADFLAEAEARATAPDSVDEATGLARRIDRLLDGTPTEILAVDADGLRAQVRQTLVTVSEEARAGYLAGHCDDTAEDLRPGADLAGRDLRTRALCGADLRGALVIAADLRGRDLAGVDLLGADLRDARLEGADLAGALFLTQAQVNAARGDAHTTLPGHIARPSHW